MKLIFKKTLIKTNWLLSSQLGIDIRKFIFAIRGIPVFFKDWLSFRKLYKGKLTIMPCLHDRYDEGGDTKNEYFWQDLFIARKIFNSNPLKHVDIGSRVDGFVTHVASFREVEVLDIRAISTKVPGVIFTQADLMSPDLQIKDYCDSLSCLHALEHFGLGRYGDPIDPLGYELGIRNMARILKLDGILYLSVPVGVERVEFNAHRIFDPMTIIEVAKRYNLILNDFALFNPESGLNVIGVDLEIISMIKNNHYGLGIFTFNKK